MQTRRAGWREANTIVEVLVAAAIGAMVLVGLYQLLGLGGRTSGASEEAAQLNQKLIFFVEQLQHDLRRAVRFVRDGDRFLLTIRVEGEAGEAGSRYQIIQYEIRDDGKAVVRSEGATLAGAEGGASVEAPVPTAVASPEHQSDFDFSPWLGQDESGTPEQVSLGIDAIIQGDGRVAFTYGLGVGSEEAYQFDGSSQPAFDDFGQEPVAGILETLGVELPTYTVAESPAEAFQSDGPPEDVDANPVASRRPPRSLAEVWVEFVDGGDAEIIRADKGLFRGRTTAGGPDPANRPVVFRSGNPAAIEGGDATVPAPRGDPEFDFVLERSGEEDGVVAAEVPGGFLGAEVLIVASEGAEGAAGTQPNPDGGFLPVPLSSDGPGGAAAGDTYGDGEPGADLPADDEVGGLAEPPPEEGAGEGEQVPEETSFPAAPPDPEVPGATQGADEPSAEEIDEAELPPETEQVWIEEVQDAANEESEEFPSVEDPGGACSAPDGIDGIAGIDGVDGADGIGPNGDGTDGTNGTDGGNGTRGQNARNGRNGRPGGPGEPGEDGEDGCDGGDGGDGGRGGDGGDGGDGGPPSGVGGQGGNGGNGGRGGRAGNGGRGGNGGKGWQGFPDGLDGRDGQDGQDGVDGGDGADGLDGADFTP